MSELAVGIRPHSWLDDEVSFDDIVDWVVRAESIGVDSVHAGDRMLAEVPPYYSSTMYEVTTALTAYASATETIDLGPLVYVMPYRHPLRTAKVFGTLDVISDGRVILGVGNGWNDVEFEALGVPMAERGRRLEDGVEAVKRLWTEDRVTFDGHIYGFDDASIAPRPVQDPHPPIWFGSFAPKVEEFTPLVERVLRRVGRLGDGWVPLTYSTDAKRMTDPEKLGTAWDHIAEGARENGRDPGDVEIVYSHWSYVMDEDKTERAECEAAMERWFDGSFAEAKNTYLIGTPDEVADQIVEATAALPRVDRVIFTPFTYDHAQQDRLMDEVVPRLEERL